eukprot:CAMPEP_0203945124 /NCGR_PEP_ID=MMETSP0359-20131031/80719_1 /ASSEMBLY_ACC=CAM_ASM_000338 /TAXON_ID=268821 /ORGANISM="Scrippsiella Hangoei, Strain SHTV-5" /LENGTH=156 /DNA_ID=CAMNT_0050876243 /DNA_START=55 /DNA_END=521 /DNA_ORIENTATION=+
MTSWAKMCSLMPTVGGVSEPVAVPSKERHGSMMTDVVLSLRRRGSTSDEELDTVELYEMLMHLGLAVCLADPGECARVVRGFARSEASALRCLSRLILPALSSSCTNIRLSGVGGQQMCAVEGILSAFLLSTLEEVVAQESATSPARSSAKSGSFA